MDAPCVVGSSKFPAKLFQEAEGHDGWVAAGTDCHAGNIPRRKETEIENLKKKKSHQHNKVKALLNVRMKLCFLSEQNVQTELKEQTEKKKRFLLLSKSCNLCRSIFFLHNYLFLTHPGCLSTVKSTTQTLLNWYISTNRGHSFPRLALNHINKNQGGQKTNFETECRK